MTGEIGEITDDQHRLVKPNGLGAGGSSSPSSDNLASADIVGGPHGLNSMKENNIITLFPESAHLIGNHSRPDFHWFFHWVEACFELPPESRCPRRCLGRFANSTVAFRHVARFESLGDHPCIVHELSWMILPDRR